MIDTLILNRCVHKHIHKMKACNQCHIKKSEVEFTKSKAVCKYCRAAIIKAERTQAKFAENEEQRAEFYREATDNGNSCLITLTQYEELRKNPKCFNITPVKDWPSPVNSMYKVPCK